jgi:hypothetical protein
VILWELIAGKVLDFKGDAKSKQKNEKEQFIHELISSKLPWYY